MKRIAISSCILPEDNQRILYNGRPLHYLEASMGHYFEVDGVIASLVPVFRNAARAAVYADSFDGLVLAGGVDVAPESYGESPLRPEWSGDGERDRYEIELFRAFVKLHKPVLGICRGMQVMNVALGGTLFQDISTQNEGYLVHRRADIYERNEHQVELASGRHLAGIYGGCGPFLINSVHHQGVKDLAPGLEVLATSKEDGIIEAVRLVDESSGYCVGVQWHPEFQNSGDTRLLSAEVLRADFLNQV